MSAIVGICSRNDGPVPSSSLETMLLSLTHRGTDGVGAWHGENIGLGHRLLRTTSESLYENLPIVENGGSLVITADARIDNRDELLRALQMKERSPQEIGDGEIILRAYEEWGEGCPEKLLGDFAFAIWDGSRQRLFCARDHFGVKQLYYYASENFFVFATEIKTLLCLPQVPHRLNEERIADYLLSLVEDQQATLYEGIYKLPPAHWLIVNRRELRQRRYWSLDAARELRLKTDAEYQEAYLSHFREAVSCRLRSDRPPGSTLSGGLDSSAIACMAREIIKERGGEPLKTFSAVYSEATECDERFYINSVVSQGDVEPCYGQADCHSPLTNWGEVAERHDEPFWNPQMALHWALYEAAREQRVNVLLDGFGGDAVVSHGVSYLNELACTGRWVKWVMEARQYAGRANDSFWELFKWRGLAPLAPAFIWNGWRAINRRKESTEQFNGVPLRPEFVARINLKSRLASLEEKAALPVRSSRQTHCQQLSTGLWSFSLGVVDRATALFNIERRHPFLDRRLVEFCLALPARQKMRQGWTRWIARASLANILPPEVQWRAGKTNHSSNFNNMMLTSDSKVLEEIVIRPPDSIAQYVDIDTLRRLYYRYLSYTENKDGFILWRIAKLAIWLECQSESKSGCEKLRKMAASANQRRALPTRTPHFIV